MFIISCNLKPGASPTNKTLQITLFRRKIDEAAPAQACLSRFCRSCRASPPWIYYKYFVLSKEIKKQTKTLQIVYLRSKKDKSKLWLLRSISLLNLTTLFN